jgi:nucleoside-diphosphate-sugar epimerase
MPSVLIAGCGYVGTAAAKLFAQDGWDVIGWTRSESSAGKGRGAIALRAADISDLETVRHHAFAADVVVHCASSGGNSYRRVYRDGAANLAACFPAARLMFTSSTRLYSQTDGSSVTEESAAEPDSENAEMLLEAEKIVLENDGVVLRVAGIYGPGRSFLLRTVMNRDAISGDRLVNQVHRDDIASAILFLARFGVVNPPRIFNVVDDTPAPRTEILQWLSARLGLPLSNSPSSANTKGRRSNKRVSNAKLRALGWGPAYRSYREGFERSVLPALETSAA